MTIRCHAKAGAGVRARLWGGAAQRLSWGLSDQVISSLTNSAVSVYIARELGAVPFGVFSLAYLTYSFALNTSRGLATGPLMVRFSDTDRATWRRAVAGATATSASVGLVGGACVLVVGAMLGGTFRGAFLALGVTLPGLMLQDSWRYAFFSLGKGGRAFLNDVIWAAALIPALLVLRLTGHASVGWFVLAWGASAGIAALAGPLQARVIPSPAGALTWLSRQRDLGLRYVIEGTSASGSALLRTNGVAAISGLAVVGQVQAIGTLMGPVAIVFLGMANVLVPEGAQALRRSPRRLSLLCVAAGIGLSAVTVAWGAALLVGLPTGLGQWLLGPIWRPAYALVVPQTLAVLGQAFAAGAGVGLHTLGAARRSLRAIVLGSVLALTCVLAGTAMAGGIGAAEGLAISNWLAALWSWRQLRAALRERADPAAGDWRRAGSLAGRHRKPAAVRSRRQPAMLSPRHHRANSSYICVAA